MAFFLFQQFSTPSYKHYATYPLVSLTERGNENDLLKMAETSFNNHNFEEAVTHLTLLLDNDPTNKELQLYNAMALIEINKYVEADLALVSLTKEPTAYSSKAAWYLCLSKLKQKDYDACINVLKTIDKNSEDYANAQYLLDKLE
jgi:predicted Zn-dependent protease